jgi:Holliday junction resolvasome RuvABC endonuclease subunit
MPAQKGRLLAIDPGTREMGYASFLDDELADYGVKSIKQGRSAKDLLINLERILSRLIAEKHPSEIALEKNNFSQIRQNIRLTLAISRIRGIAKRGGIPVFELDPRTIRKVLLSNGNGTKRDLARFITALYPEMIYYLESNRKCRERYFQNAFDAIACGLTFIEMSSTFGRRQSPIDSSDE